MKKLVLSAIAISIAFTSFAQEVKINAAKSEIKWTGKKVTGEHWGYISLQSGTLNVKNNKIASGKFVVDMNSISVKDLEPGEYNDNLVGHLKSDDFFGVAKFPTATLEITESGAFVNNEATVNGKLTIKGITNPINFKAVKTATGYTAQVVINRAKYDIRYGSGSFFDNLGDKMIYDDFTLDIKLAL
jgi:polyisoprenoid-binding protein YceI